MALMQPHKCIGQDVSMGRRQLWQPRRCSRARHVAAAGIRPDGQQEEEAPSTSTVTGQPSPSATTGPRLTMADPVQTIAYGGRLPSGRRMLVGGLTASAIALGGNLGGITSWLLALDGGKTAKRLRADVLIPVNGFKRCVDYQNGYEFSFPASWLADQTLVYRAAQRAEEQRGLPGELPSLKRRKQRDTVEPSAAFGPPGSSGEENVSVIVAPIYEGFRLQNLGSPSAAAETFLTTIAAPPGSDKTAQLIEASSRQGSAGELYYSFEFAIQGPKFRRHNVSVLASRNNILYTFNAQCSEDRWPQEAALLKRSAASFSLSGSVGSTQEFPNRL